MSLKRINWPADAVLARKNSCTFYSHFTTTMLEREDKVFRSGDFLLVKLDRRVVVMLAEITHLWIKDCDSSDDGMVRVRLFARPEDTNNGRNHTHGEHELLLFHKYGILTCQQLLAMEQHDIKWNQGIPLQPSYDPSLPPSPSPSIRSSCSATSSTGILYCNEKMIPIGSFEAKDQRGASPYTSPRTSPSPPSYFKLHVTSHSSYCRYRAVLAQFGPTAYQMMDLPSVKVLGGIPIPDVPTLLLFCHRTFKDINLERKLIFNERGGTSNAISLGGYKRPASSCSSSSTFTSLTSSGTNVKIPRISNSSESSLKGRGRPPKKKRGRPRKVIEEASNISNDNSLIGSSSSVPFKRKRGRPRKHENNISPNEQHPHLEINKDAIHPVTSSTHQNHLLLTTTNSLTENGISNNLLHEPMMANELNNSYCPRKHIVQPATIIPSAIQELTHPIMSLNTVTSNSQTSSTFEISSNTLSCTDTSIEPISNNQSYSNSHMTTNPHQVVYATILSHSMTDTVTTQPNCSLSSAHKQQVHDLARNLRPRSSILPPPQFREDSIYDVETTPGPPSKNIPNGGEVLKPETSTCDYLPTRSTITTPISTVNTATSVPLTQVQTDVHSDIIHPSIYTSTEAMPTSEAPQEVKDLLQTHLSHLQCPPPSTEIWTNKMQNDVASYTLDENTFLDILFCFMKMRKTPIHRIPRLGSKCLNLFELFKITTSLGGYEQVTINRKWNAVFDAMGCSTGMTCASTITRKHYEKLLLPFEKALTNMK